ncbi:linked kinase-associated serine/threonine phosphatase 2C [Seminavis robusta]|uniref:Linked kinase-associated serine/threonine phosphatase 2C n=1 Tax=Seminavis robusta TaxID=568900 RepID=A0A9N8EMJ2_9STRA|nr:linked kinase-associated serine/threonine phosphatase 2C [Seminavis robusta]|eukprot:Sro1180_g249710.1 linked kinase-associated serine/threonine phosphatase 2C (422) ;mRNA; f:9629-11026
MSSLMALAASAALLNYSNNVTKAEPPAPPSPMATSVAAVSASPFQPSSEHQQKMKFTGNIRRRVSSIQAKRNVEYVKEESKLPLRFQFYKTSAECEGGLKEETSADILSEADILSKAKPYEVSIEAFQGRRETMEDEVVVNGGGRFAAVFDGHGGGDVSLYLKQHLYHLFLLRLEQKHWEESDSDVQDIRLTTPSIPAYMSALREGLHSVETEIIRHPELNFVGSTAVAVVLHENPSGYRTLISANVGDSRAILCRDWKAVDLTKDHKPTAEGERKRILRAGGRIFLDDTGVHRVMNLSLSRAIGDGFSKPIVSPEPDIRRFRVEDEGDEFILLASDGLWDVMSSQDAVNFVRARLDEAQCVAERMSKEEKRKKMASTRENMASVVVQEAMKLGSADNTSVAMVWLKNPQGQEDDKQATGN